MNLPGDQKLWLYSLAVMAEEDRELPLAELANLPAAGIKITIKPNIDEIFRRFVRNDFGKKHGGQHSHAPASNFSDGSQERHYPEESDGWCYDGNHI